MLSAISLFSYNDHLGFQPRNEDDSICHLGIEGQDQIMRMI